MNNVQKNNESNSSNLKDGLLFKKTTLELFDLGYEGISDNEFFKEHIPHLKRLAGDKRMKYNYVQDIENERKSNKTSLMEFIKNIDVNINIYKKFLAENGVECFFAKSKSPFINEIMDVSSDYEFRRALIIKWLNKFNNMDEVLNAMDIKFGYLIVLGYIFKINVKDWDFNYCKKFYKSQSDRVKELHPEYYKNNRKVAGTSEDDSIEVVKNEEKKLNFASMDEIERAFDKLFVVDERFTTSRLSYEIIYNSIRDFIGRDKVLTRDFLRKNFLEKNYKDFCTETCMVNVQSVINSFKKFVLKDINNDSGLFRYVPKDSQGSRSYRDLVPLFSSLTNMVNEEDLLEVLEKSKINIDKKVFKQNQRTKVLKTFVRKYLKLFVYDDNYISVNTVPIKELVKNSDMVVEDKEGIKTYADIIYRSLKEKIPTINVFEFENTNCGEFSINIENESDRIIALNVLKTFVELGITINIQINIKEDK